MIDPIDGTRSFILGQLHWATLIALNDGTRVGRRRRAPAVRRRDVRRHVDGAAEWRRGGERRRLATRRCARARRRDRRRRTDPRHFADPRQRVPRSSAVTDGARFVRYGGDCYCYTLLAMGLIDIVIETGLQAYDVQALIPLIEAAGGVHHGLAGRPLRRRAATSLACGDPALHAAAPDRADEPRARIAMRLLILGGTRFLGRHVVDAALARGHAVTIVHARPQRGSVGRSRRRARPATAIRASAPGLAALAGGDVGRGRRHERLRAARRRRVAPTLLAVASRATCSCRRCRSMPTRAARSRRERAASRRSTIPRPKTSAEALRRAQGRVRSGRRPSASATRATHVRPGLIVGPFDSTDRFGYWVARFVHPHLLGERAAAGRRSGAAGAADAGHRRARSRRVDARPRSSATSAGRSTPCSPRGQWTMGDLVDALTSPPRRRRRRRCGSTTRRCSRTASSRGSGCRCGCPRASPTARASCRSTCAKAHGGGTRRAAAGRTRSRHRRMARSRATTRRVEARADGGQPSGRSSARDHRRGRGERDRAAL